jgi:UDP-N-acetylmuramoyl-L-alanyl-D-glutamate--2,6-diaminopimelate ligase
MTQKKWLLSALLPDKIGQNNLPDLSVTGITADSRLVKPGFIFVAIPGTKDDGARYIEDARAKGAAFVLLPKTITPPSALPFLQVDDPRQTLGLLAARLYPKQPQHIVAVTGTNGKTSTTQFVRDIWHALGHKAASLGTLGLVIGETSGGGSMTTPDAVTLHQTLDHLANQDVQHMVMEASSHGLHQHRLDHVQLCAAAFTNLTRDHLDYHETMENYAAAKGLLFKTVMKDGTAVINADSDYANYFSDLAKKAGHKIWHYGHTGKDIRLIKATPVAAGQHMMIHAFGKDYEILFPVVGTFQASNILAAIGLVHASGISIEAIMGILPKLKSVRGRLELAGITTKGASVFVDYAHTPDALENVLTALRPHVTGHKGARLGVVFGCGGNRDKGKRPIMGSIAERLADFSIVTDDNPRLEDPVTIRKEIVVGYRDPEKALVIGDRREAIAKAIQSLAAHDVLVIAGKGHEEGQIVGTETLPFDDVLVVKECLRP